MNANRLIEEWRQQGRILEVKGAYTDLRRMGQGETVICVHGGLSLSKASTGIGQPGA
jgi:hypothetical protein